VDNFIAEVQKHIPKNGEIIFERVHSSIDFKNVYFHYDNENEQVIRGFSAEIPKNNTVAIVGPSGAGKSTIVNLLGRLYDPQEGRILVDGVDLRDFDVSTWRRRISIVSQDIVLFNDTVANNIAFGEDSTTRHKIVSASKLASANTFIEELPDGYDTMLGDRGVRLSGGQKQRIAIARAFLSEPDVLIIDEGTSHLDSVTEYEIQKAVASLSQNRTVVIIAHRLSTIKNANKILVMENGRIVENGSHNELIELQGNYWNLLNHQKLDLFDGSHSINIE
jgi:ABC-type multidrug transport system fused ATPase/permease subunit